MKETSNNIKMHPWLILVCHGNFGKYLFINRPGVAGAVLQSPL